MKPFENKISIRQIYIIFFIGICSSLIEILPLHLSSLAGPTLWLSPFINFGLFLILIGVLHSIFKNNPDKSLMEIMDIVFGKIFSKLLFLVYIAYFILRTSIYLRYFGERLVSTLYSYGNIIFFISALLILIFFVVKKSIENLARFCEIFIYIFIAAVALIVILAIPDISLKNFAFPNLGDIINNFHTIPMVSGVFSYITFALFLGNYISRKQEIRKQGLKISFILLFFSLAVILVTVGVFGHNLVQKLTFPFFSEIKNISIFKTIERVESVFITLWLVTDFVIISFLVYITSHISSYVSKSKDIKYISTPIIFLVFICSLLISNNIFELDAFSKNIVPYFSFTLGFIVPIVLLTIGKLRRKI